ncbi:IS110 family transposase [Pseudoclavibacter helvolus]|uniref:IS110 family transposase n=1 Tax=Pseudoclavibacter helvolus TaxID=255205 RepID=UPI0016210DEE|nr:IS110 family transposase [Pseudoclavibacter helvolus]
MTTRLEKIFAGVDTHADTHHAAVIDSNGKQLGDAQFPTTPAGYAALAAFLTAFGMAVRVGVEGTGSYGAGLARHLGAAGFVVVEVLRPNRQLRRTRGKSDPLDAYAAARTALAQDEHATPKAGAGQVEAIRYLLVARRSAVKARTAAIVQIKSLLVTAPDLIRERYRSLGDKALIAALARLRLSTDPLLAAVGQGLRSLARRHQLLGEEVSDLDQALAALTAAANPALVAAKGIGTITAAQLLVTAGDNPDRLRSEASFAALAGVSPIPASSGKTTRHRLNRGGDRQANAALHRIALVRMSYEPRTRDYVARKRALGHSNKEIIRCLKRALAREVFTLLTTRVEVPVIDDLRPLRQARKLSLTTVAEHFNVWPATISKLERGKHRDDDLANSYREWLTAA